MANVNVKVGYTIDKTGLNEIKRQLTDIRLEAAQAKLSGNLTKDLQEASKAASQLEDILNSSWNNKLNQLDLSKVNTGIKNTYGSVQNLQKALVKSGSAGATAYNNFAMQVLNTNIQLKQTSETLDKMAVTFKNTIRYGISSSIFNTFTNTIQKAYDYTVKLDTSLNDIRIVTGKSADEMDKFAVRANKVAKDLGRSTKDFTEASLIYYQQGLGNEEAQARAEVTMKAANVTGQAGQEVSEQLTAVWNGYKVTAEEAELYVDKLAAVAADTAADLEELSTGMSKVASAANIMGVDVDQLNAQLATIVSVTRQAPESVGVALKTIYARMSDIKSGLDDETTLGNYTAKMAEYGVNVLDANGNLRDMGKVIEEIGEKWASLSREQQVALSQTMAGTRQYNNLLSLFDNWDMYTKALETSANAARTLQKQQDIYMESTRAHLQRLSTEAEKTYDILFDQDTVNNFSDALTGMLSIFNNLLAGLGGGTKDFVFFGTTIANIFNKQIGGAIERQIENIEAMRANLNREELQRQIIQQGGVKGEGVTNAAALEKEIPYAEKTLELQRYLTKEQAEQFTNETAEIGLLEQRIQGIEQYKNIAKELGIQISDDAMETQEIFEEQIEAQSKLFTIENKRYKDLKKGMDDYVEGTEYAFETNEQELEIQLGLIDSIESMKVSKEQMVQLSQISEKIAEGEKLTEDEIKFVLDTQRNIRNDINNKVQQLKIGAQGVADEESGILIDLQNEQALREKNLQTMQEQVERQKQISQLVQGVTALASLLTSLSGIVKTLNDDSLSAGEKAERVITVLISNIPILLTNLNALKGLLPTIASLTNKAAIAMGAQGVTAASGFGASLAGIVAVAGPYVLAIGAIAGAIYLMVKASQEEQKEINKMKEAAEALSEQAKKTQEDINAISQDFDKYKSVLSTLDSCTKGTKEWDNALKEVNSSALAILDKYPDLAKVPHLFSRIDGALTLNQSVLDEYLEKQERSAAIVQSASLMTASIANKRQNQKDTKDLINSIQSSMQMANRMYYPNDTNYNNINTEDINNSIKIVSDNLQDLGNLSESEYKARLVNLGVDGKYIETLMKYQDQVDKLVDETDNAAVQMRNTADAIAAIAIGDKGSSTNTQTALYSEQYQERVKERQQDLYSTYTGSGISKASGGNNRIYLEMLEQLQQVAGFENFQSNQNGVRGTDKNRYFVFNVNGEEKTYSANEIASIIAENQIEKELSKINYDEAAEGILEKIQTALSVDKEVADEIIRAIRDKDYNSLSEDTIRKIEEAGIEKEILSPEELKSIGLDAGTGLLDGLNTAVEQWDPEEAKRKQEEKIKSLYSTAAEATEESEETIKALVNEMKKLSENADATEEDLIKIAKTSIIFNNNLQKLADSFADNRDLLKEWQESSEEMTVEMAKAVGDLKEKFDTLFDSDVSIDFLKDNLADVEALLNGDTDALNRLEIALGKEFILNIDDGQLAAAFNQAETAFDELANTDLVIGAVFDDEEALAEIQRFFNSAKLSQEEAQEVLNKYGYEGELEEIKEPDTERTTYDEETSVTYTPVKSPSSSMPILDGNGYKMETLPPMTSYIPNYTTKLVPHTEKIPGKSYWVLKSKDGKGSSTGGGRTSGLVGSVKSLGTGRSRRNTVSNFSGYTPNSGKSGSGGGGGSAKEPDIMDNLEKEIDRYHDVNVQLELIGKDLDKLDKQRKKLFGQDLISNLNKRLGLLNKQIDTTNEKIKIAKGETQELQDKLRGKGVSFNTDGTIANYAQAYASQLNYVNSLINQYNSMSAEAQEGFKDTVDKAKEDFDKFVDNINRYDNLITDMIPGLEANIQAAVDEKIDLQIEKFDMEIELRLNMAEAERDWNEFKKKIIDGIEDDDILGNAMAKLVDFSSYYKEDNTGIVQALRKQVDNTLAELAQMDRTGQSNIYGDNRTAALDDLKKYYEELMNNLKDVLELQEEIHQSYMDMMDEAQEKFDEQIETYEMISDLIEHDMEVISLVYGEESYGQLAKYYDKQQQNFNSQLDFQRQQVDFWRQQLDALEEGSDEWDNAREKWANAVQEMNDLIESSIENLQDKYLNAINLIFQNLNNKVTDGLGLDYIEEEWNLINQNADQYLDTINSLYEVQKLESKYLDALDQTDSVSAQRQLKKLMDEELANLRERDKLTQYDVERANKKYEIALKQIALQEAQQNKSKMRLRRDSQGNYRYEYTADGDQIGQLQDELNDMYNSLYNFDKARYQDNLNQMYSVWVEFQEKMAEAAQINDPVARSERELLLQTQYEQLINGLTEQNATVRENLHESAFDDLSRLYDVDVSNFQNMSDQEKEVLMGDLLPYWESGVQHMTEVFAGEDGFLGVCKDAFDQLHDATKDYEDGLDELENIGRISFEGIGESIDENINRTQQLITDNTELINSYEQELTAIGNVISQLDDLVEKYNSAKDAAVAATKAAYEYWSEQQRQAAEAAGKENKGSGSNSSNSNPANSSSVTSTGVKGSGSGDGNLIVGDTATLSGSYYYDSYGTSPSGNRYSGVANGIVIDRITNNPYGIHIHSADGRYPDLGWVKKSQLSGYDTGGYTGEWGSDGRLALLHQKELVLNKEDTANMLNAISIMRNITNMLGSSVLGKLAAATAGGLGTDVSGDVLEQNVHIDAQFPNVKDSREIEEALNNLVNMASMRANRR